MRKTSLSRMLAVPVLVLLAISPLSFSATAANAVRDNSIPPQVCAPSGGGSLVCAVWKPMDPWTGRPFAVMTTTISAGPGVSAYVAWLRTSRTDLGLYPGYKGPGPSTLPRGPEMVPPTGLSSLVATFNSGFYEADVAGGFFTHHLLYYPMVKGMATVVRYANGKVDILSWTGGPRPPVTIQMARQNLPLLVDNARPTPLSADNSRWGLTLHGVADVWRSALGIDAMGNLMYVAAPAQTASSLASILVRLHAVRAMELDINPEWPILVTYGASGARVPSLFVPNPNQIPSRFLSPSTKDFFALYLSSHPGEPQPW